MTLRYYQPSLYQSWVNWYIPLTYGGLQFYYYNGSYYRHNGFGFTLAGANIGTYIYTLPFGYRTILIDSYPYYYVNRRYYIRDRVRNAYLQVDNPYAAVSYQEVGDGKTENHELYVYPNLGQTEQQTGQDKYECHLWAVDQSGYDPSQGKSGPLAEYQRAQSACLEGRGYTVR